MLKADKEEDIYEDLCSFNGRGSKKLQSDVHNFQPKEKRDYILKELLETEFNYVEVILGPGVTNKLKLSACFVSVHLSLLSHISPPFLPNTAWPIILD